MHGGDEEVFVFGEAAELGAEGIGVGLLVAGEAVGGGPVDFLSHCVSNGGCGGKGISGEVEAGLVDEVDEASETGEPGGIESQLCM